MFYSVLRRLENNKNTNIMLKQLVTQTCFQTIEIFCS